MKTVFGEVTTDAHWSESSLCGQTDPEMFFPGRGGDNRMAKKVCSMCEVRVQCLEDALSQDEQIGIAGGLSARERRRLKKLSLAVVRENTA